MPLPEFKNEADFRDNWIMPFLTARGFIHVRNTHGPAEQGKDFFFADRDAFDHLRVYALQAKHGDIREKSAATTDLFNQIQRAFNIKLQFHKSIDQRYVSAVYVMASGRITKSVRETIWGHCTRSNFGENVYLLDGEDLSQLAAQKERADGRTRKHRLTTLLDECCFNLLIANKIRMAVERNEIAFYKCRIRATEDAYVLKALNDPNAMQCLSDVYELLTRTNLLPHFSGNMRMLQKNKLNSGLSLALMDGKLRQLIEYVNQEHRDIVAGDTILLERVVDT